MSENKLKVIEEETGMKAYQKVSDITEFKAEMIAIMHKTVAKGTSISELAYFLSVCKGLDLNPLNREVWCYKDNKGNLLIFTGRDGFLAKAQKNSNYNGLRSCEVRENDVFRMDIANAKIVHEFSTKDRGKIVGAYAIAFVKNAEPTIEWVKFTDYDKGRNTWSDFPADMIKKVVECHALKKAFGMSNLNIEYDFEIKGNIATQPSDKPEPPKDKSEDRILQMIEKVKSKEDLEKLLDHCTTQKASRAYDAKLKSF